MGPDRIVGRWQRQELESEALRGNKLGDPHVRPLYVWQPDGDGPFPAVYVIQGMTGMADAWFNVEPFSKNYPQLVEELEPSCIVVLVDAFTKYGGSQFVDSPAIGNYHTYLCDEIVPWVDARYPTLAAREHRGIQGKSSGGYGAMITPMLRPDLFGGLATHAGDALFEVCYQHEFAPAARALRDKYAGSYERFWAELAKDPPTSASHPSAVLLNTYCMAAAYSPNEDGTVELPWELETATFRPDVFARWLEWDPVRRAHTVPDALRGLRAIWIDSGNRDDYYLDLGATAFRRALAEIGVPDDVIHFELFDGTHGGIVWRYPLSLAFLAERLQPDSTI
jgi:S-formylglutathione hydrolase FrmB